MNIDNTATKLEKNTLFIDIFYIIFVFIIIFFPIYMHLLSPFISIPFAIIVSAIFIQRFPGIAALALLAAWILQNLFVSLLSPLIANYHEFNIIRSYNFLITAVMWCMSMLFYAQNWRTFSPPVCKLMTGILLCLILATPYFAFGLISNPTAAVVYLRNILAPLMLFQIFLLTARYSGRAFHGQIRTLAWLVLLLACLEAVDRDAWLFLTNGYSYWEINSQPLRESGFFIKKMQHSGEVLTDLKEGFRINLFNAEALSDLGVTLYRLMGPNMHAISFGYALAFFLCVMALQKRWLYVVLCIPLLVLVSAKGALITLFLLCIGIVIVGFFNPVSPQDIRASVSWMLVTCIIAAYAVLAVSFGLYTGDYHAIGLMSGIKGFIANPLGHGLGSGGNLSGNFASVDWTEAQKTGQIAGAAESGIGVLLYQMGIGGCCFIAFYAYIGRICWNYYLMRLGKEFLYPAFAIPIILVNALLQEEALFAPLGLGFVLAYAGQLIGYARSKG